MQPMMLSRVDFPLPEGPAIARNTPGSICERNVVQRQHGLVAETKILAHVIDLDDGHL